MRNVLIISFSFYDINDAIRMRGLVKYLPEFGWNPVVLTAGISTIEKEKRIFETPYEDLLVLWKRRFRLPMYKSFKETFNIPSNTKKKTIFDKILQFWGEFFIYPDQTIDWSVSAIEKGNELLHENHYEAIVSSISPVTSHIIASELKKRNKIPWIADFRDLWTQNTNYPYSRIRKFFEEKLELNTLVSANALVTVSDPLAKKLNELHKNNKIYTITNGYDPEQINPGISLTKKFSITFTGMIYKQQQDPEPLFRILKVLIDEKMVDPNKIEVNFFGNHEGWLINDIKKYHLENIIQAHGQISRDESIQKQRESQILLLLTWNDPSEKGVYTGKLFDYLAAHRPILALGLQGNVITELLNQTKAGINVSTDAEIKEQILKFYQEYEENGYVKYSGILSELERYTHREMARKFAEVLEDICEPSTDE